MCKGPLTTQSGHLEKCEIVSRPYLQKSIKDLEALFVQNGGDVEVLASLEDELDHRKTPRALALKKKIIAAYESVPARKPEHYTEPAPKSQQKIEAKRQTFEPKVTAKAKTTLKRDDLGPKPTVANAPQDILRAWTALEVLSPQGYRRETDLVAGDRTRIARFEDKELPWKLGEKITAQETPVL